ncbi:Uncharacterised protein [uncultured archaeon]|nr:Uncharacterised protein [uncultured archaeon]
MYLYVFLLKRNFCVFFLDKEKMENREIKKKIKKREEELIQLFFSFSLGSLH